MNLTICRGIVRAMQLPESYTGDDPLEHKIGGDLFAEIREFFLALIEHDYTFLLQAIMYGFAVSLLTLALPVTVQLLINSIAYTASMQAVISLSVVLLILLLASGTFTALQTYICELFERRFYARLTAQFTLRNIYAQSRLFEGQNRHDLANRYFDIINVQKIVTSLTIGMFTLVLQMIVGIVLVSFYHPWLFVFNVLFLLVVWLIWRVWGYRALGTAIDVSQAKYRTARHIEDVAFANSFYKSSAHAAYAIQKTDTLTERYIKQRKHHFKHTFAQHIALLALYAVASALLLGIGGVLVIKNQLTLGQLVAAELVLAAVFYGMSRMSAYLTQIYELGAAAEEIMMVYQIPLENLRGTRLLPSTPVPIHFNAAQIKQNTVHAHFDFTIEPGQKILVSIRTQVLQEMIIQILLRHRALQKGSVMLGDHDIQDYAPQPLRDKIIVLDRSVLVECTIREFFHMRTPDTDTASMRHALEITELNACIDALPQGLDTPLSALAGPLTTSERLRLKLAAAYLAKPQLLIINEFYDTLSHARRVRIFTRLCADKNLTLLYFSNRKNLEMFDRYLYVEAHQQISFAQLAALRAHEETIS